MIDVTNSMTRDHGKIWKEKTRFERRQQYAKSLEKPKSLCLSTSLKLYKPCESSAVQKQDLSSLHLLHVTMQDDMSARVIRDSPRLLTPSFVPLPDTTA